MRENFEMRQKKEQALEAREATEQSLCWKVFSKAITNIVRQLKSHDNTDTYM